MSKHLTCEICRKIPWSSYATPKCICSGCNIDVGCGPKKQRGFLGLDKREMPSTDIVWDIESVIEPPYWARKLSTALGDLTEFDTALVDPWPLPDDCVDILLCSHVLEHVLPSGTIAIMDEMWRVIKPEGKLLLSVPYANSFGFWQDPTHIKGFNQAFWTYFDPESQKDKELYSIYTPKPWKVIKNDWSPFGSLETIAAPRKTLKKARAEGIRDE